MNRNKKAKGVQADGFSGTGHGKGHRIIKKGKLRQERRKAKRFPECIPTYRHFGAYET